MAFIFKINNREYSYQAGETILNVARRNKIFIPTLCFHPDFPSKGNCRLCLVEIIKKHRIEKRVVCVFVMNECEN